VLILLFGPKGLVVAAVGVAVVVQQPQSKLVARHGSGVILIFDPWALLLSLLLLLFLFRGLRGVPCS